MKGFDLSLVICTLNESESIGAVLREVDQRLSSIRAEVIVVDDSENDDTARAVSAFVPRSVRVRLLRRQGERGLASAAAAGWAASRGRVLGLMDGDGQHDPALLMPLFAGVDVDAVDIAVASRYGRGARTGLTGFRDALSHTGTWLARLATGVKTSDPMSGFFLFHRSWWEVARHKLTPVGYKILLDLALSGPRKPVVAELPTTLRMRIGGQSKLDVRVIADLAAHVVAKNSGGIVTPRFVLFATVGVTGLVINIGVVSALTTEGVTFGVAQIVAVAIAMTTNFILNNLLTFRDRRLQGRDFWSGLLAFYLASSVGVVLNETVGISLHGLGAPGPVAAFCGAIPAAIWNYVGAKHVAWAKPEPIAWSQGRFASQQR